jgi:hypothetical protein
MQPQPWSVRQKPAAKALHNSFSYIPGSILHYNCGVFRGGKLVRPTLPAANGTLPAACLMIIQATKNSDTKE